MVEEELDPNSKPDQKLESILELIGNMAALDFTQRIELDDSDEPMNAIAHGLSWLNEELENNVVQKAELELLNSRLERFAYLAAHDLKAPLNNVGNLVELLKTKNNSQEAQEKILDMISASTNKLKGLIEGLLMFSQSKKVASQQKSFISPKKIYNEIKTLFDGYTNNHEIQLTTSLDEIHINKAALDHVLVNLISNAIKYNDKDEIIVELLVEQTDSDYTFKVRDNGPGIDPNTQKKMFDIFESGFVKDRFGNHGNGIGLSAVKNTVDYLKGSISVDSNPNQGTTISFTIGVE